MSPRSPAPNLPPVVADIFTVPIPQAKPLKHPEIYRTFRSQRHHDVVRALRHRRLWSSNDQGDFLFSLLNMLPADNMSWIAYGVNIPPSTNCYNSAAIDIFQAATTLPSQATRYLTAHLAQSWAQPDPRPTYNDRILMRCYQLASQAKDIRQSQGLGLLCGQFLTPDSLCAILNETRIEPTFVGTRTWTTVLEVALEDRASELLYNDMSLGDFLAHSPITGHRLQKISQLPLVQNYGILKPEWINDYHTTS